MESGSTEEEKYAPLILYAYKEATKFLELVIAEINKQCDKEEAEIREINPQSYLIARWAGLRSTWLARYRHKLTHYSSIKTEQDAISFFKNSLSYSSWRGVALQIMNNIAFIQGTDDFVKGPEALIPHNIIKAMEEKMGEKKENKGILK